MQIDESYLSGEKAGKTGRGAGNKVQRHLPIVTGGGRPKEIQMHWSNTGLGNLKGAINGTCRSCDARHTDRYLAAYEWRFNRRFELD